MDWPRLVIIIQLVIVAALYLNTVINVYTHNSAKGVKAVNEGRAIACLGVVVMCGLTIYGFIDLWGGPLTLRLPLAQVGAILLLWGWIRSVRFRFNDARSPL